MQTQNDVSGPRPQAVSRRPLFLLGALLLLLGATGYLLPKDPVIAARLMVLVKPDTIPSQPAPDYSSAEKLDPTLGSELPRAGAGAEIRAKAEQSPKGYLLVGLGDCASCISFDFAKWRRHAAQHGVALLAFSSGSREHIAEFLRKAQVSIPIFEDAQGALTNGINAYWGGRLFYYDASWRLRWMMHGMANPKDLNGLEDLKAMLEARR